MTKDRDPVQTLIEALGRTQYPSYPINSASTLKAFLFDKVTKDWLPLFNLYKALLSLPDRAAVIEVLADAVQRGQVTEGIAQIGSENKQIVEGTDAWKWFEKNKAFLSSLENPGSPEEGSRVRLHGLTGAADLNDAVGQVVGPLDTETGRFPIVIRSPPPAVIKYPDGVRVKPANMECLVPPTATLGVGVDGFSAWPAYAFDVESTGGWRTCPVPTKLGYPLIMRQLSRRQYVRDTNESVAVYMMADDFTGLAPPDIERNGLGPAIFVRSDGKDLTVNELFHLHDYNCMLMDIWGDDPNEARAALTPEQFRGFGIRRAKETEENMDAWEEDDDQGPDES